MPTLRITVESSPDWQALSPCQILESCQILLTALDSTLLVQTQPPLLGLPHRSGKCRQNKEHCERPKLMVRVLVEPGAPRLKTMMKKAET
uniref:Uncharacterized protein n=1 Tax=Oryza glumipatula TaxID=40148 RepID=A0A0E0BT88_9ORYZ